jgi:Carboxypeptidase regulatory-like domain
MKGHGAPLVFLAIPCTVSLSRMFRPMCQFDPGEDSMAKRLPVLLLMFMVACGDGGGSTPAPSSTQSTLTVRGTVFGSGPLDTYPIAGARVEVLDGANTGRSSRTDGLGKYVLENLTPGEFTVRATALGYQETSADFTLADHLTRDFTLSLE